MLSITPRLFCTNQPAIWISRLQSTKGLWTPDRIVASLEVHEVTNAGGIWSSAYFKGARKLAEDRGFTLFDDNLVTAANQGVKYCPQRHLDTAQPYTKAAMVFNITQVFLQMELSSKLPEKRTSSDCALVIEQVSRRLRSAVTPQTHTVPSHCAFNGGHVNGGGSGPDV